MTEFTKLARRLRDYFDGTGVVIGVEAAIAIETLTDKLVDLQWRIDNNIRGCQCSDDEACAHVRRAEKAEAERDAAISFSAKQNVAMGAVLDGLLSRAEKADAALSAAHDLMLDSLKRGSWADIREYLRNAGAIPEAKERKLSEPCSSCTGHIRENNPDRCRSCSPLVSQNYERRLSAEPPTDEEVNASVKRVGDMFPSADVMQKAMREAGLLIEKSCETCGVEGDMRPGYLRAPVCESCIRDSNFLCSRPHWQPKPTDI